MFIAWIECPTNWMRSFLLWCHSGWWFLVSEKKRRFTVTRRILIRKEFNTFFMCTLISSLFKFIHLWVGMAVRNSIALKLRRAETIYAILCILTFLPFHRHCVESYAKLLFHVLAISAVVAGMLMLKKRDKNLFKLFVNFFLSGCIVIIVVVWKTLMFCCHQSQRKLKRDSQNVESEAELFGQIKLETIERWSFKAWQKHSEKNFTTIRGIFLIKIRGAKTWKKSFCETWSSF